MGPGYRMSGRSVIARAYPADAAPNDNLSEIVYSSRKRRRSVTRITDTAAPPGTLASIDDRQMQRRGLHREQVSAGHHRRTPGPRRGRDRAAHPLGDTGRGPGDARGRVQLIRPKSGRRQPNSAGQGWRIERGLRRVGLRPGRAGGGARVPGPRAVPGPVPAERVGRGGHRPLRPGRRSRATASRVWPPVRPSPPSACRAVTVGSDLVVTGESPAVLGAPDADMLVLVAGEDV